MEFEPYKIKVVENIPLTTRDQRESLLEKAKYNLFGIPSSSVTIDLLTDSGTGALSDRQWSAIMEADEAYAGSESYYRFEKAVRSIFGFEHIIPTHQGRAAEHIFFKIMAGPNSVIPSNTHFDTTRANIEYAGAMAVDCTWQTFDPMSPDRFKGNMNIEKLNQVIKTHTPKNIPCILMTITNNLGGGQPASLDNIKMVSDIARGHSIPFFLDAARFAENCYFIRECEQSCRTLSIRQIARELFSLCDGCLMSAKKDGLNNIGGFFATNNPRIAEQFRQLLVLFEGLYSYGGMAGRDLEAIAQGLTEVVDERYLRHRIEQVEFLGDRISENGIPCLKPFGGHAVFVDAKKFLSHIPAEQFPGQVLACELYLEGGVRSVEAGSLMCGATQQPEFELVRLAIPRRVYTNSQLKYVADVLGTISARKDQLKGLKIKRDFKFLRHFLAELAPITQKEVVYE